MAPDCTLCTLCTRVLKKHFLQVIVVLKMTKTELAASYSTWRHNSGLFLAGRILRALAMVACTRDFQLQLPKNLGFCPNLKVLSVIFFLLYSIISKVDRWLLPCKTGVLFGPSSGFDQKQKFARHAHSIVYIYAKQGFAHVHTKFRNILRGFTKAAHACSEPRLPIMRAPANVHLSQCVPNHLH